MNILVPVEYSVNSIRHFKFGGSSSALGVFMHRA